MQATGIRNRVERSLPGQVVFVDNLADQLNTAAGDALRLVMQWQVNPTSLGHRDLDVTLKDGDRTIAIVRRDLRVWP